MSDLIRRFKAKYRYSIVVFKELVKTDFQLRYQGSFLGVLWSVLKPLMLFAVMYMVFVRFLRFSDGTPTFAISLLCGTCLWSFFSEATTMGMQSIVNRGDLLRKVHFPSYIIVACGCYLRFLLARPLHMVYAASSSERTAALCAGPRHFVASRHVVCIFSRCVPYMGCRFTSNVLCDSCNLSTFYGFTVLPRCVQNYVTQSNSAGHHGCPSQSVISRGHSNCMDMGG